MVVGYKREEVISHLKEIERRWGLSIEVVDNPHWEEENGTSVLAAAGRIPTPFLLLMSDHLIDSQIIQALIEADDDTDISLIAVDEAVEGIADLDEATKVRLEGDKPLAIGKEISPFHAVDMGAFLCKVPLFEALQEARVKGDTSLSGGVQRLIEKGKIRAVRIKGGVWIDIDTPYDLERAERVLLDGLRKEEDGFISYHINRPISRMITAWLVRTPLTPNGISLLGFALAALGGLLFAMGGYLGGLFGGVVTQFASIIDGCDGEVARLKFRASPHGGWMDTILDRYADGLIALGIIYGRWSASGQWEIWLGGAISLLGFLLVSYTKKEFVLRFGRRLPFDFWDRVSKRDLRLFGTFLGGVFGLAFEAMLLLGLISHGTIIRYLWRELPKKR